jgi:DNA polymerase III alpha subunit (gram-positive type)
MVVDVETTGLSAAAGDRVIEIGASSATPPEAAGATAPWTTPA